MKSRRASCPSSRELSRAFPAADDELQAHLAACPDCAAEWSALQWLVELGRELPAGRPTDERRDEVRTALLASPAGLGRPAAARRRWPWIVAGAVVLAVAGIGGVWLATGTVNDEGNAAPGGVLRRATVHAQPHASFVLLGAQPDEIVRLNDGALTVEVAPLRPGERFRVVTADAEVEVRGTAFDVVAAHDRLVAVRVLRGRVVVRPSGGIEVVLAAGERWPTPTTVARAPEEPLTTPPALPVVPLGPEAATPTTASTSASGAPSAVVPIVPHASVLAVPDLAIPPLGRSIPARSPVRSGVASAARPAEPHAAPAAAVPGSTSAGPAVQSPTGGTAPEPAETAFDEGWRALRDGDLAAAAEAFRQAAVATPAEPLAEDAMFWRAVALGRAGRDAEAGGALAVFLDRYASSPRAREASAMYGWILLRAGDLDAAEARFRAAAGDSVPAVRDSAQRGLQRVETARQAGTR